MAFVVPGVGVYNAGAGLATAWASSSPVLLVAGQINRHGIGAPLGLLHEVHDQLDLVRPITAWQQRAHRRRDPGGGARGVRAPAQGSAAARGDRDAARGVLRGGRGRAARRRGRRAWAPPRLRSARRRAARRAERPLVWAGGGVVLGDASAELTAVVEHLQAPVITTREGKGAIDDRNPLSVGTMWVNKRLRRSSPTPT